MGRIMPVYLVQRQLEYAQKRAAYYGRTDRPVSTTRVAQPRTLVGYKPLFYKVGTAFPLLKFQASEASVNYFTLAGLGLTQTAADIDTANDPPRGFKPSLVKLMEGTATPTVAASPVSGRRVIKYSAGTAGTAQAHYQAPISAGAADTTPTIDEVKAKVAAIKTAKASVIGTYGRLYFIPEKDHGSFA